jgi:high-affinity iron transporter
MVACQSEKNNSQNTAKPNQTKILKVIHTLNYLKLDYKDAVKDGKVINQEEYKEQLELIEQVNKSIDPRYATVVNFIETKIKNKAKVSQVEKGLADLKNELIRNYQIKTLPPNDLDMKQAKKLYTENCMICHGEKGDGKGEGATGLEPKPTNFVEGHRAKHLSLFQAYTTITFGVDETSMQSYSNLSEKDRWALAKYVMQFRK